MIEGLQSLEWITWGNAIAIFGLLVLIMVALIQHVQGRGATARGQRWSLAVATAYGLIFSIVLVGLQALTTGGIGNPPGPGLGGVVYWVMRLGLPTLLFVIVAAIRNQRIPKEDG